MPFLSSRLQAPATTRAARARSNAPARLPRPQRKSTCACGGGCPRCNAGEPAAKFARSVSGTAAAESESRGTAPSAMHEPLRMAGMPVDAAAVTSAPIRVDARVQRDESDEGPEGQDTGGGSGSAEPADTKPETPKDPAPAAEDGRRGVVRSAAIAARSVPQARRHVDRRFRPDPAGRYRLRADSTDAQGCRRRGTREHRSAHAGDRLGLHAGRPVRRGHQQDAARHVARLHGPRVSDAMDHRQGRRRSAEDRRDRALRRLQVRVRHLDRPLCGYRQPPREQRTQVRQHAGRYRPRDEGCGRRPGHMGRRFRLSREEDQGPRRSDAVACSASADAAAHVEDQLRARVLDHHQGHSAEPRAPTERDHQRL